MSDQGKFINTYIDVMVGTIHETLNSNLQLKTQMKISADLLADKDKQISSLIAEIESKNNDKFSFDATIESNKTEIDNLKSQLNRNQQELESLRSKASHTDSLLQQIVTMKQEIKNRDAIIMEKDKEIEKLVEQKVKKSKSTKAEDVVKPQQINIKEDNLLNHKDDF